MTAAQDKLTRALALIAPGTGMRDGLERIVHGRTGALIVLGHGPLVDAISTGGFVIDVPFTPTALRELAKMDGAIVVDESLQRILRAAVHLMPDAGVHTTEAGTRHRTADRVARQTRLPVVTVSASMSTIALFVDGVRHLVERPHQLLSRANQALATLTRYRGRLAEAATRLSALEVHDQVAVRDVALLAQRLAMVRVLRREISQYVIELGVDGRMVSLQLAELAEGLDDLATLLVRDYARDGAPLSLDGLAELHIEQLGDLRAVAAALGLPTGLDTRLHAVGHRQLAQLGFLSGRLADRLLEHFGNLHALFGASASEIAQVKGMTVASSRRLREGLVRLAEAAYAEPME